MKQSLIDTLETTIQRAKAQGSRKGRLIAIAEQMGDKRRYQSWVSRFASGEIRNPQVLTLQAVIDALDMLDLETAQADTPVEKTTGVGLKVLE